MSKEYTQRSAHSVVTDLTTPVTPNQADRDAAAEITRLGSAGLGNGNKVIADEIKGGLHDGYHIVDAFRRHRIASEQPLPAQVLDHAMQVELGKRVLAAAADGHESLAPHRAGKVIGDAIERLSARSIPEGDVVESVARALWADMVSSGLANDIRGWEERRALDGEWSTTTPGIDECKKSRVCSAARAAIAALQPHILSAVEAERGWQPIETAPKDGTIILGYGDDLPTYFYAIVWEDGEWRYCSQGKGWCAPPGLPTHWRPLPDPPIRTDGIKG